MKKAIFLFSFIHFCYLSFAYEKLDSVLMADLNPEFNTTKALNNDCLEQECTKLKIIEYVEKNKKYPVISKKNNITGRVIVKFIHDERGNITNVEIIQSVDKYLDSEAIRLIKSIPKLKPFLPHDEKYPEGYINIPRLYKIPVIFELNDGALPQSLIVLGWQLFES